MSVVCFSDVARRWWFDVAIHPAATPTSGRHPGAAVDNGVDGAASSWIKFCTGTRSARTSTSSVRSGYRPLMVIFSLFTLLCLFLFTFLTLFTFTFLTLPVCFQVVNFASQYWLLNISWVFSFLILHICIQLLNLPVYIQFVDFASLYSLS